MNTALLPLPIGAGSGQDALKWHQVHRKLLTLDQLEPGCRPARRVLALHATVAMAWAEAKGWIPKGTLEVPEAGWSSPGYDVAHMQKFLSTVMEVNAGKNGHGPQPATCRAGYSW